MYKFGKKQQSSVKREPELAHLPLAADLRNLLSTAQRNAQKSVELAFHTPESPVRMTLVVKCERHGKDSAFWSLYRTDVAGLPVMWTQQSSAIDLVENLVELGYSTAVEAYKAEVAASAGEPSEPAVDAVEEVPNTAQLRWSDESENYLQTSGNFPTLADSANEFLASPNGKHPYLESSQEVGFADDAFRRESSLQSPALQFPADQFAPLAPLNTHDCSPPSGESGAGIPDVEWGKFAGAPSEPVELEQALAISKERKYQALTGVLERLTADESIVGNRYQIIVAVRLVINPFDTGGGSNAIAAKIDSELKVLVRIFGEQEVAIALRETFARILDGKSAPYVSAIDEVTSRWFF